MSSNFDFLSEKFPSLAKFGQLAEKNVYSDPNTCMIKLGMLGENIVNLMFDFDHIDPPYDNAAVNRINTLWHEGLIDNEIEGILHTLRKKRNQAAHEDYDSADDAKTLLPIAYSLSVWFFQTYGDWDFQAAAFTMPGKDEAPVEKSIPSDKPTPEEEKLVKETEEKAKNAPKVSKEERKKKSQQAANQRPRTEAETRVLIDAQLRAVGWEVDTNTLRYSKGTRPQKGKNMAIAEWPTDSKNGDHGYVDYALFIGEKLVAMMEAKAIYTDIPGVIDGQCKDYASNVRSADEKYVVGHWAKYAVPFTFATNGRPYIDQYKEKSGIWFKDMRDSANIPKALKGNFSPEGLQEMLEKDTAATEEKLKEMPYDLLTDKDGLALRPYQVKAIQAAEEAIDQGQERILLAMATGTGKTRTVLGMIYRFLKAGRFKRILFLVDRNTLGKQARDAFNDRKIEDLLTLNQLYDIKGLDDTSFDKETKLQIATVQGLVKRLLYSNDETMPAVSDYDLIIADEAHRGYILDRDMTDEEAVFTDQKDFQSKYRYALDYFDAVKIGLTATPALQTTQIFGQPVFEYTYREAVIEGYLVDHDAPHILKTKLELEGIHYKKGDKVTVFDPITQEVLPNLEIEDEVLDFDIDDFNKKVITPEFNKAVLEEIARDIDPEGEEKTLIFAVNDAHADMIVNILRKIYSETGVDSEAVMKITGYTGGGNTKRVEEAVKRFKNEHFPTIAVTVDLLTTGVDVPEITTLVFLRRVRSRILFEQMMGRATRLCPEIHKTHFDIYDPVGVYEALEPVDTMKPVVADPSVSAVKVADLLLAAPEDNEKEITYHRDQLVAKLRRREKHISAQAAEEFQTLVGMPLSAFEDKLLNAETSEIKPLVKQGYEAIKTLYNRYSSQSDKIVISDKADELVLHTRGYGKDDQEPEDYLDSFREFVQTNRNEIAALNIVCTRPGDLTREGLKSLRLTLDLAGYTTQQLDSAVHQVTNQEITADIISLIRQYAIGSPLVSHEERIHRAVEKLKQAHHFSKQEENWIDKIEKYLMEESVINVGVYDEDSRFKAQGGFTRMNKIFGNELSNITIELNTYLYEDGGRTA